MEKLTKILSLGVLVLFVCTLQIVAQESKVTIRNSRSNEWDKGVWILVFGSEKSNEVTESILLRRFRDKWQSFPCVAKKPHPIYDYDYDVVIFIGSNTLQKYQKSERDTITLGLSIGKKITLYVQEDVKCNSSYNFAIDAVTLQKIAIDPPTSLRFTADNNEVWNFNFSIREGKKMAKAAARILK